ncbi:MAG: secondary thiamine-phosphate synthase enzyme YjbQ [Syntrophales bacterium]|nr:secondary thiamine-phosphate synthase enzyme YjbQ [Syntrophales bacterium]
MTVHCATRSYGTTSGVDVLDITRDAADILKKTGITDGMVVIFVPGSTAAVTTIEYESGVVRDLVDAIERLAPRGIPYRHDARWGDGNGYAHVRAALLGPSLTVPVAAGRLMLGTWQQIVLIDFDNRPRDRRVIFQVSGQ